MTQAREGYKMTELGEIPVEWEIVTLDDIATVIMGQSPNSDSYNEEGEGLPFYQGKTEFGRMFPIPVKWCTEPLKIAKNEDVLISVRAPVGEVNICQEQSCIGRGLAVVRAKESSNYKYIYYLSFFLKEKLNRKSQGSTFTAINSTDLRMLKVPQVQLKEQQKIAEILSTVDTQIEKTVQLIEQTKQLKKGLMQQLLTRGIGYTEFKDTELGKIPIAWNIGTLEEVASISMGQSPDSSSYNEEGEGLPFYQGKSEFGRMYPTPVKWCTKPTRIAQAKDVLISVRAPVGEVNICQEESCIGRGLAVVREKAASNYKFIYYLLYFLKDKLNRKSQGSTFTAINSLDLRSLKIPIVNINEQQKIADILSTVDTEIESYEAEKAKYEELKKGLMQQLLTGKVRVKV